MYFLSIFPLIPMRLHLFLYLIMSFLMTVSCVKPKIYKAELSARSAAEAREKMLVKELGDRKNETSTLIKQVSDLSRTIGVQENEISNLRNELSNRTQVMGASSSRLANEKAELEKELTAKNFLLNQREETLQRIRDAQTDRKKLVDEMDTALASVYAPFAESGVTVTINNETVLLTLPDKSLFDDKALNISAAGKELLMPLAEFLAARPSLDVDVEAYTDNILPPKEKSLKDTWDWSLQRATNLTRVLIREFNINANQLTPVGRGEFYPITSNETPEGRQKNRRTVVVLRPALPAVPGAD